MTSSSLLSETRTTLIAAAIDTQKRAYAPYSGYQVGAALLSLDGRTFTGCNVENAVFPATICAERTALVKAISEGVQTFQALAVTTRNGGTPCGLCRQMLYEFAPDLLIFITDDHGGAILECTLRELLPHGFGPRDLREPSDAAPNHAAP